MVQLLRLPRKAVTIICLHSSILCITPLNDQIPIAHLSKVLLYQIIVQNEAEKSEGKHHAGRRAVKESNLNKVLLHVLPTGWNFIEMWRYASIIIILGYEIVRDLATVLRYSNEEARARVLLLPLSVPSRRWVRRAAPVASRSPRRSGRWQRRGAGPFRHSEAVVGKRGTS